MSLNRRCEKWGGTRQTHLEVVMTTPRVPCTFKEQNTCGVLSQVWVWLWKKVQYCFIKLQADGVQAQSLLRLFGSVLVIRSHSVGQIRLDEEPACWVSPSHLVYGLTWFLTISEQVRVGSETKLHITQLPAINCSWWHWHEQDCLLIFFFLLEPDVKSYMVGEGLFQTFTDRWTGDLMFWPLSQ